MLDVTCLSGFGGADSAGGPHAYWRIIFTGPATGSGSAQTAEIEMRATVGGADQCAGGTPIASGYTSPYSPDKAFDNAVSTFYQQWSYGVPALGQWIGYHFSAPVDVAEFYFYPSSFIAASWPTAFALEYSDDGVNWNRVKEFTGLSWSASTPQTFTI